MGNKHNYSITAKKIEPENAVIDGALIAYELRKIIGSHFPDFQTRLAQIADHRKRKEYSSNELLSAAMGMFIFKAQSRNAINNDRSHSSEFATNFSKLFNVDLAHMDAVQDFFELLPPAELERIKTDLIKRLIEKKVFYNSKISGHYTVAVDGSGVISCDTDRFGCGLKQESKNGKITYLYPVLEAKLVTEAGFCISLATEWIINDSDQSYDKQDCELKAFKRLVQKLKKAYPRLPICILADALYANDPVMSICESNEWKYIITLKEGSLPAMQDCLKDDPPAQGNSFVYHPACTVKNITITQQFYWVEDLLHKKHTLHYLQCKETIHKEKNNTTATTNFVRITNLALDKSTVKNISRAGRLRWKIENEGFNQEKNNGYAMAHLYARKSFTALQNYYQSMLIAHMLNQLLERSSTIQESLTRFSKLTIKYLWQQLMCTMKCGVLCPQVLQSIDSKKHQIRLYSG